ncbi:putative Sel1-like repeat-containing protein [Cotonvirus japonicus]|uniref:Sel1-like repeat-containing protein n=1 Tax=Cotonvirus japonicus TaxID=2811091 RepID=A0ABM7NRN9_9VIRU|nr:putative Sel1-like repeat-containing protein [Cotonvirus japonicus]BCS82757.1 putative Sel1-like repeat-containing protein [Cotonvirus japonicus]
MEPNNKTIKNLAKLANNNDNEAQDKIVDIYMIHGNNYLINSLIEPLKWNNIHEKCCENQKYIFLILGILFYKKEYALIIKNLLNVIKNSAESGDALGQFNLAMSYAFAKKFYDPRNLSINYRSEILYWLEKAAKQNLIYAQCALADVYYYSKSLTKNYELGYHYLLLAINSGNAIAENILGSVYLYGKGVPLDEKEALKWYTKSAEKNYMPSQEFLGNYYTHTSSNNLLKFKWHKRAAKQGNVTSQNEIAFMYNDTKNEFYDELKALKWFQRAAYQGDKQSLTMLELKLSSSGDTAQELYWYFHSENKRKIMEFLNIRLNNIVDPSDAYYPYHNNEQQMFYKWYCKHFDNFSNKILPKCQLLIIQNKYNSNTELPETIYKYFELLEIHIMQIIKWDKILSEKKSYFMVTCLEFKSTNIRRGIQKYQDEKGLIPWINEFRIRNQSVMVFEKDNVELFQQIVDYEKCITRQHTEFLNCIKISNYVIDETLSKTITKMYFKVFKMFNLFLNKLMSLENDYNLKFKESHKFLFCN